MSQQHRIYTIARQQIPLTESQYRLLEFIEQRGVTTLFDIQHELFENYAPGTARVYICYLRQRLAPYGIGIRHGKAGYKVEYQ
jgi:hypothetical protein